MDRLEAVRAAAREKRTRTEDARASLGASGQAKQAKRKEDGGPEAERNQRPSRRSVAQPPPLRPRPPSSPKKPAHLLVAQLEADAENRRNQEQENLQRLLYEHPSQDIAKVSVDVPKAPPKKRRIPDRVIFGVLGALVLAGLTAVWATVDREPAPEVTVDPALQQAAEKRKRAIRALEKGHSLAAQGATKAKAAISAYRHALSLDPKLASAERGMAVVYAAKNDDARAVKHYRRYLKLAPDANDAAEVRRIIRAYEKAKRRR